MEYTSVTNPQYADESNRSINCWVKFTTFPSALPFTASPEDPEPHAKKILAELKAGKYGPIGAFGGNS